ncbi:MAG TPA: pseudouridine synthase [Phnomibacter sp.]|nr:pseudouridine synthase [Phnomibacter sp.]
MHKYYLIYKPFQVMSQFSPVEGKQTLKDFFEVEKDVYPIGRLDYDSEGLLLLTNDKSMNQKLVSPDVQNEREYYVQVEGDITQEALRQLESGVTIQIDGKAYQTRPAKARLIVKEPKLPVRNPPIRYRANIPTSWISLSLTEGKNRQVRRMTAAVGFPTLRLVRWRHGRLTIEGLDAGDIRILQKHELK